MSYLTIFSRAIRTMTRAYIANSNAKRFVPPASTWNLQRKHKKSINIDEDLVRYLERTSLVRFSSEESRKQLYEAIGFADQIKEVNTDGIEPMHSLLENESLYLREDKVTDGNSRQELMAISLKTVEDWYYVAPPGNIPLDSSKKKVDV